MAYHQRLRYEEEHNRQQPQGNAGRSGLDGSAKEIRNHHHQNASKDQVRKSKLFSERLAGHLCGFFSSMYVGACDAGHAALRIRLEIDLCYPRCDDRINMGRTVIRKGHTAKVKLPLLERDWLNLNPHYFRPLPSTSARAIS